MKGFLEGLRDTVAHIGTSMAIIGVSAAAFAFGFDVLAYLFGIIAGAGVMYVREVTEEQFRPTGRRDGAPRQKPISLGVLKDAFLNGKRDILDGALGGILIVFIVELFAG